MIVKCLKCGKRTERFGSGLYQAEDPTFKCDCGVKQ